jgi:lipopolysaccharide biosynthesis regulator YciM
MDFDLSWLLLALPAAFALGWMASRLDLRQSRKEHRDAPRAYFKGLSLLLNEQQDKAIDAFIEAIQNDPDTVDLHFALGSLFRRRGEFQRAIRVHEHLLSRPGMPDVERHRARHALAQDFLRAGLFDRAEESFRQLEGTSFEAAARLALLSLQERAHEWDRAIETAHILEAANAGSFSARIGHYHCEAALELHQRQDHAGAAARLEAAHREAPDLARPWVLGGQWAHQRGALDQAFAQWQALLQQHPVAFDLVAVEYAGTARALGQAAAAAAGAAIQARFDRAPSLALLQALLALDTQESTRDAPALRRTAPDQTPSNSSSELVTQAPAPGAQGMQRLVAALYGMPSLSAAALLLRLPVEQWGPRGQELCLRAVERAARPVQRYRCAACGFEAQRYFWQCPGCLGWDTFPPRTIEELEGS